MSPSAAKQRALDETIAHVAPQRVSYWQESGIPLVIGRREGPIIWDLDGRPFYDMHIAGGTFNLGHRNPELVATMIEALNELDVGIHHFPSTERAALGAELSRLCPGDLRYSVFASGGGEAGDVAIKSARVTTGRRRMVTLDHGYHGRTGLSGAAGDDAAARYFLSDAPGDFARVGWGDIDAIDRELERGDVAGVLLETIPGTYGFPPPPPGFLAEVARRAHSHGALYIADEVQTGLGRTGPLWAIENEGVQPDILVTAKGFSGGLYPIAATVLTSESGGWLEEYGWGHAGTTSGSELGCRVARKVLEITTRTSTVANVERLTAAFADGLTAIRVEQPWLVEVRQRGLVMGLRTGHANGAVYLQRALFERGVWAIAAGFDHSVLQFKPPLILDVAAVGDVLDRLRDALLVAREQDGPVPRRHRIRSGA